MLVLFHFILQTLERLLRLRLATGFDEDVDDVVVAADGVLIVALSEVVIGLAGVLLGLV